MSFNWKEFVGSVAPTLATALGSPIAGIATKAIAGALLGDENAPEKAIEQALASASPDTLLKLKEADHAFKAKMEELGVDLERIAAGDRDSARKMAIATTMLPQIVLASIFVIGFVAILYAVFTGNAAVDGNTKEIGNILLGILSAGIIQILNFFFGSSAGSLEKTRHMAEMKG